jgi:hypothetical protein
MLVLLDHLSESRGFLISLKREPLERIFRVCVEVVGGFDPGKKNFSPAQLREDGTLHVRFVEEGYGQGACFSTQIKLQPTFGKKKSATCSFMPGEDLKQRRFREFGSRNSGLAVWFLGGPYSTLLILYSLIKKFLLSECNPRAYISLGRKKPLSASKWCTNEACAECGMCT